MPVAGEPKWRDDDKKWKNKIWINANTYYGYKDRNWNK